MNSSSQTKTHTAVDVRRVVDSFAADFWMIAQSTSLRSQENVGKIVFDLKALAEAGFLEGVRIILWNQSGQKIRARNYSVSENAIGWANDDPGGNLWPRLPVGASLQVVADLSQSWWSNSEPERATNRLKLNLNFGWTLATNDISLASMTAKQDKRYSSNGYGMLRTTYE